MMKQTEIVKKYIDLINKGELVAALFSFNYEYNNDKNFCNQEFIKNFLNSVYDFDESENPYNIINDEDELNKGVFYCKTFKDEYINSYLLTDIYIIFFKPGTKIRYIEDYSGDNYIEVFSEKNYITL